MPTSIRCSIIRCEDFVASALPKKGIGFAPQTQAMRNVEVHYRFTPRTRVGEVYDRTLGASVRVRPAGSQTCTTLTGLTIPADNNDDNSKLW